MWWIRIDGQTAFSYEGDITVSGETAWPDPDQKGFKTSTMRFWQSLKKYSKPRLGKLAERQIRKTDRWERTHDTIVITDRACKGIGNCTSGLRSTTAIWS